MIDNKKIKLKDRLKKCPEDKDKNKDSFNFFKIKRLKKKTLTGWKERTFVKPEILTFKKCFIF